MDKKKIGLALSGGSVLGTAHIGSLRALEENGIRPDYIAGTSIGAFVGAFYAFGFSCDEIEKIALEFKWLDIVDLSLSKYALLSNGKMEKLIKKHLGDRQIEEAKIPLAIVATDIAKGKKVVFKKGPVSKAVMASTCIPGIFKPVEIEKKVLVDGGVLENLPVKTVKKMGAEHIIAIDLNAKHKFKKPGHILDVIIASFHLLMKNSTMMQSKLADWNITPDLSRFNYIDSSQIPDLIKKGYEDTRKFLEQVKNPSPAKT